MLQTIGTIIVFLACPLMMIFMMKGMHGGHNGHSMHNSPKRQFNSKEEEMADLQNKIQEMQEQFNRLTHDEKKESTSHDEHDRFKEVHF